MCVLHLIKGIDTILLLFSIQHYFKNKSMQVTLCSFSSLLLTAAYLYFMCTHQILSLPLSELLGCLQLHTTKKKLLQRTVLCLWVNFSGVDSHQWDWWLIEIYLLNFIGNTYLALQKDYTGLCSYQQCVGDPIFWHSCYLVYILFFNVFKLWNTYSTQESV